MTDFDWFDATVRRYGLEPRRVDDGRLERIVETHAQSGGHAWTLRAHHSVGVESPDTFLTSFCAPGLACVVPGIDALRAGVRNELVLVRDDQPEGNAGMWGEAGLVMAAVEVVRAAVDRPAAPSPAERVAVDASPRLDLSDALIARFARWPGDAWFADPAQVHGRPARTRGGRDPLRVKVAVSPWQPLTMHTNVWADPEQLDHAMHAFGDVVLELLGHGIVVARDPQSIGPPDQQTVAAMLEHAAAAMREAKALHKAAKAEAKGAAGADRQRRWRR